MNDQGNILDQLYHQIDLHFGSKREEEYFCMIQKSKEISMDESLSSVRESIENDQLTNCFCAPYQMVHQVMPTTLSARYSYLLATWIGSRKMFYEIDESWVYGDERAYIENLKTKLITFDQTLTTLHTKKDWQEAYESLYHFTMNLMKQLQRQEKKEEHFGERELQEAKTLLHDMRVLLPQQGSIYPVNLQPTNWRSTLTTSFTQMERLPSLANGIHQYLKVAKQREQVIKQLLFYKENIAEIQHFQTVRQQFLTQAIQTIDFDCDAFDHQVLCQLSIGIKVPEVLCSAFYHALNRCLHHQPKIENLRSFFMEMKVATRSYEEAYQRMCEMFDQDPLVFDLIKDLKGLNQIHQERCSQLIAANRKSLMKQSVEMQMLPQKQPSGYESILVKGKLHDFATTKLYCEKEVGIGLNALFGSAIPCGIEAEKLNDVELTLGCLICQIEIDRPWFKESVLAFSSSYVRMRNARVSHGGKTLKNKKHDLLPSYPTRMVIAKDVTLCFDFHKAKTMLKLIKKHAKQGNGFLCFHDRRNKDIVQIDQDGDTLMLRYPKAYVLGYFMNYTSKDESRNAQDKLLDVNR